MSIRYAVVGLGHIAQTAVLPAFAHAKKSRLQALVSNDEVKLRALGRKYGVKTLCGYDDYDELLRSDEVDAVYIALPNHLHKDYTVRAAKAGIHVLCEKPMALNAKDCLAMIRACEAAGVKLMIAYRLHFEESNLKAIQIARDGRLGEPRFFNSVFAFPPAEENIRVRKETGGGPLYDIGPYCINAARYLFGGEPLEVFATMNHSAKKAIAEVEETVSAILKFPEGRIASFTCSFGTASVDSYQLVGTAGDLFVENGYSYSGEIIHRLTLNGKTKEKRFESRDQFAPELTYFSDCILKNKTPEPSGYEGLADIRIIEAIQRSAATGRQIALPPFTRLERPSLKQEIKAPAVKEPEPIRAQVPQKKAA